VVLLQVAMSGKGRGRAPPPPPPAPTRRHSAAGYVPKARQNSDETRAAEPSLSLGDALQKHSFRNTGIVPLVKTRGEVEKALARYVPTRIREANAKWQQSLKLMQSESKCKVGVEDEPVAKRVKVSFADQIAEVVSVEAEHPTPSRVTLWALSAGIARSYKDTVVARAQAIADEPLTWEDASQWPPFSPGYDPDVVWESLKSAQVFCAPEGLLNAEETLPERPEGHVRFVCISDTHGRHRCLTDSLPAGDVLLHAGDFSMNGELSEMLDFGSWLASLPYSKKIVTAGNHDVTLDHEFAQDHDYADVLVEEHRDKFFDACADSVIYLEDREASISGIRIYGSPYQPEFGDWAFKLRRGPDAANRWSKIPEGIDILLVHGPPLGRGDKCEPAGNLAGCADLLGAVQGRVKPKYCINGHIHEARGASSDGITTYVNASSSDIGYKCAAPAFVFDLPKRDCTALC